jgi:hypothetical protein
MLSIERLWFFSFTVSEISVATGSGFALTGSGFALTGSGFALTGSGFALTGSGFARGLRFYLSIWYFWFCSL